MSKRRRQVKAKSYAAYVRWYIYEYGYAVL